jgi:hypothetical protein
MKPDEGHNIARPIVPNTQQSGCLTAEDLEPKVEFPVLAEGIDLHAAARAYLDAQSGKPVTAPPVLRDAVRAATHFTLERDVRILIDHDTKVWESLGHKNFEEYYQHETGEKIAPSTAWRRRLVAETALLLGARGCPELIPSQRQCERIRKHLTREHGILFLLQLDKNELHRMGEIKLTRKLEYYRISHGLPLIGQRVDLEDSSDSNPQVCHEDADAKLLTEMTKQLRGQPHQTLLPSTMAARMLQAIQQWEEEAQPTDPAVIQLANDLTDKFDELTQRLGVLALMRITNQVIQAASHKKAE